MSIQYQKMGTDNFYKDRVLDSTLGHRQIKVRQQIRWGEALTGGCCECNNHYTVLTEDETELFRVLEDSSCCNRCFCNPHHTFGLHLVPKGSTEVLPNSPMLLHREGCCGKWLCCFSCGESCQNTASVFVQDPDGTRTEGFTIEEKMCNGCCNAEFTIVYTKDGQRQNIAVIHGPTLFGGCSECCFDSDFFVTTCDKDGNRDMSNEGNVARIKKVKPDGLCGMLRECCTDVDNFEIDFADNCPWNDDPNFRGLLLGALFYLDYMFFEMDMPMCGMNSDNSAIIITLCNFYWSGCICPIYCCIPVKNN